MSEKIAVGDRFGRWVVIELGGMRESGRYWLCGCECGNKREVYGGRLIMGRSRSCGCLQRVLAAKIMTTHGGSKEPEYHCWVAMINRCNNPNWNFYSSYGGKGIKVCRSWVESYRNFKDDMGDRPSDKHTIDRTDNNKGYSPSNCRWATYKEQNNNKKNNRIIEFQGTRKTLTQWAEHLDIEKSTLAYRLNHDWGIKRALTQEVREY